MGRYGYDYREYRGRPDARHSYGPRGYQMDAGWGWDDDGGDPNWRGGGYQGMRMEGGGRQAAYGRERLYRQNDLGGHGGFDGRSDLPNGWYDGAGYYHEQYEREGRTAPPPHSAGWRAQGGPGEGGVRYDREYLRQYNAHSPALGPGGPRRGWGFSAGPDAPPMRGYDARYRQTDERGHAGYNTGGFAEGKFAGPGTRQSIPMQKGGR
jgi:hypothetical protein